MDSEEPQQPLEHTQGAYPDGFPVPHEQTELEALPPPPPWYDPYAPLPRKRSKVWLIVLATLVLIIIGLLAFDGIAFEHDQQEQSARATTTANSNLTATVSRKWRDATATQNAQPNAQAVVHALQNAALPLYKLDFTHISLQDWINHQSISPMWTFQAIAATSDATWWYYPTAPGDAWSMDAMGIWVFASPLDAYHAYTNYLEEQSTVAPDASMAGGAWFASYSAWDIGNCLLIHGTLDYANAAHRVCGGGIITPTPTPTSYIPPTIVPTIRTADDLFRAFISAGIAIGDAGDIPCSWWLSFAQGCPAHGSMQFIDEASHGNMVIALFGTYNGAMTDAQQAHASSYGWGLYQVGTCLLLYQSSYTNLTPYEQIMQQDCA